MQSIQKDFPRGGMDGLPTLCSDFSTESLCSDFSKEPLCNEFKEESVYSEFSTEFIWLQAAGCRPGLKA